MHCVVCTGYANGSYTLVSKSKSTFLSPSAFCRQHGDKSRIRLRRQCVRDFSSTVDGWMLRMQT